MMTHTQAAVALIVGLLTIVTTVGGFGIALIRRWMALEQYIKVSAQQDKKFKKSDRKLKNELRKLIENKYQDHVLINERLGEVERELYALRSQRRRVGISRRQQ